MKLGFVIVFFHVFFPFVSYFFFLFNVICYLVFPFCSCPFCLHLCSCCLLVGCWLLFDDCASSSVRTHSRKPCKQTTNCRVAKHHHKMLPVWLAVTPKKKHHHKIHYCRKLPQKTCGTRQKTVGFDPQPWPYLSLFEPLGRHSYKPPAPEG